MKKLALIGLVVLVIVTTVGAFPVVTLITGNQSDVPGRTTSPPPHIGRVPPSTGSRLTRKQLRRIRLIEAQEITLRGLRPLHSVGVRILNNKPFSTFINRTFSKGSPPSQIKIADIESVMVGLFPSSVNLKKIVTSGLSGQVVGLYDHRTKKLYIRNTGQALSVDRWTIAHEYTHAMQDQHFNLNRVEPDQTHWRYKNSDAGLAEHSLIEGDAVRIQQAYFTRYYTPAEQAALIKEEQSIPQSHIPSIIEQQFTFPYVQGLQYVQALAGAGGNAAVNRAFRHPPQSTYQIMFGRTIRPVKIRLHSVGGAFAGWKVDDDDVMGAFGYQQLVERYVAPSRVVALASLWRGDRYVLLEHGKQRAMFLESAYHSSKAASTAAKVLESSFAKRFRRGLRRYRAGVWTGKPSTYVALHSARNRIFLAYAPTASLARALSTARPR
jgi:hypothetical protein